MLSGDVTDTLYEASSAERTSASTLARGESIARYLLLERVGAGGMGGVVWAAYDPKLDRRIALKLLHPRRTERPSEEPRARLIREAQAMARLSHPNVIAVHDVGQHDGQVFLAMEFVEGQTLARWLTSNPRRAWREIVAMFVQAGRGLAAAHRAGLVHRDFKPDNVLIGTDERARVTDFGLARSIEIETLETDRESSPTRTLTNSGAQIGSRSSSSHALTQTGTLLGTPAYMAPEQFGSGRFDERSDQFSFCVALWEALYGQRPFTGRTLAQLSEAVMAGQIVSPPSDARVPGWLERAMRRGLATASGDRWPDIAALLHVLEHDNSRNWRRGALGIGLVSVAVLAAGPILIGPTESEPPRLCSDAEARLVGIWDSDVRNRLEPIVLAATRERGPSEWLRIGVGLHGYAHEWQAMYVDACEATHVRGEQSAELLDRRMQCLDERRESLHAAVELLGAGEQLAIEGASKLIAKLPDIESCANRTYLMSRVPIPSDPALAKRVTEIRSATAAAKARVDVGDLIEPIATLEGLLEQAESLDYPPLRAELLTELAFAQSMHEPAPEVRERLELAVVESIRTGQDTYAARAGAELIYVVGDRLRDPAGGLRWAALVRAWHDRTDADANARALALMSEGFVLNVAERPDEAKTILFEALALLGLDDSLDGVEQLEPRDQLVAVYAIAGLATVAFQTNDIRRASELFVIQLRVLPSLFASDHDQVQHAKVNLAMAQMILGSWAEARALLDEVVEIDASAKLPIDPTHESGSTRALALLAELHLVWSEQLAEGPARAQQLELAQRCTSELGERGELGEIGTRVRQRANLARLDRIAGNLDRAEATARTGLAEFAEHPIEIRATLLVELARVSLARGEFGEALAELEQVSGQLTSAGLANRPVAAVTLGHRSAALVRLGRVDEAKQRLGEALAILAEIAPEGHPLAAKLLDARAELEPERAAELQARASELRRRSL